MDIEKEIDLICSCRNGSMDDKQYRATVSHNIHTLLERRVERIRAEILKLPTASIGKWDNEIVVIPRKDVLNLKSLQPTIKDNPQKE